MSKAFGRDEMNALLGGPGGSDGPEEMAAFRQSVQQHPRRSSSKGSKEEVDISKLTAAETAKLLLEKTSGSKTGGNNSRVYRSQNKKKVLAHHQLLAEELSKQQQQQQEQQVEKTPVAPDALGIKHRKNDDEEDSENEFVTERRPTQAAVVIRRRSSEKERERRRRRMRSDSSSSSSDDGNRKRRVVNDRRSRRRRREAESSSDSSSDDECDRRRNRRALASRRAQEEPEPVVLEPRARLEEKDQQKEQNSSLEVGRVPAQRDRTRIEPAESESLGRKAKQRRAASSSDSDSESSSGSSSSDSSSSSSSSEEDEPVRLKPIFVPKHKRNLIQSEEKKWEEEELRLKQEKERNQKRKAESRALVAKELSDAKLSLQNDYGDDVDDECGGANNAPPNDDDELDNDKEHNAWELRELERLLKAMDKEEKRRKEAEEYSRRKKLTDAECLKEDIASGRYQAPGANRNQGTSGGSNHLKRYFHRGAYYMDQSEWDEGDIRQKAAEYAKADTGEDKIDKSKLPEVMQVKNFGRARQNTKYKGLASEDTTDKSAHILQLRPEQRTKRHL